MCSIALLPPDFIIYNAIPSYNWSVWIQFCNYKDAIISDIYRSSTDSNYVSISVLNDCSSYTICIHRLLWEIKAFVYICYSVWICISDVYIWNDNMKWKLHFVYDLQFISQNQRWTKTIAAHNGWIIILNISRYTITTRKIQIVWDCLRIT